MFAVVNTLVLQPRPGRVVAVVQADVTTQTFAAVVSANYFTMLGVDVERLVLCEGLRTTVVGVSIGVLLTAGVGSW